MSGTERQAAAPAQGGCGGNGIVAGRRRLRQAGHACDGNAINRGFHIMLLGFLRCLILPHKPDRRRVNKVTDDLYYGHCRWCGANLRRVRRDRWVRSLRGPESAPE